MLAFRINVFAFCSLAFFEVSHSQAFSSLVAVQATVSTVRAASGSQLAECDAFDLLRLRMRRKNKSNSKQEDRAIFELQMH